MKRKSLFEALKKENPLQIVGTVNAYSALQAKNAGFNAIYISGAGVANASYGLPDLAITTLDDVLIDVRRISSACDLPILVDIDTGFGSSFNISRTITEMIKAGASAVHMEDQVSQKRCGHRPKKQIVSTEEMCDRIKSAVDAKNKFGADDFVIMARTDAIDSEGIESAIFRAKKYVEAGADMIFAEAVTSLDMYKKFADQCKCPILANMTEFGKSENYTLKKLKKAKVSIVLYPLSAYRAMSKSAEKVYNDIRKKGDQNDVIKIMQTREELYKTLNYYKYEEQLDRLFNK